MGCPIFGRRIPAMAGLQFWTTPPRKNCLVLSHVCVRYLRGRGSFRENHHPSPPASTVRDLRFISHACPVTPLSTRTFVGLGAPQDKEVQ